LKYFGYDIYVSQILWVTSCCYWLYSSQKPKH